MHVFKLIASVARRHWMVLLVYLVVLSVAAVCMGLWTDGASTGDEAGFAEERPKVAVIDRDNSAISRAISASVAAHGTVVAVEDSTFGLQDAAAKDLASFVLVIPEGYGEDLFAAAESGADAPALESVVSHQGARGALMREQVHAYVTALYGFASVTEADAAQVIAWADEACAQEVPVAYAQEQDGGIPAGYLTYALFSGYAIFCATTIFIAVSLASLERIDLRRRLHAAPTSALSYGLQSGLACIVFGLFVWAFEVCVGLIAFSGQLAGTDPALTAVVVSAQFAYLLFAVAVGFLLWHLEVGEEYANAIGNVFGMLFSFMGGAWMPLDLMGDGFLAVARFTPGYWAMDAMQAAAEATTLSGDVAARVGTDLGITLLFALAALAVGLVASRVRLRERSA